MAATKARFGSRESFLFSTAPGFFISGTKMPHGMQNITTIKAHEPMQELFTDEEVEYRQHPLDTPENQRDLDRLKDWWFQAQVAQRDNRVEMARDQAFYDGEQWDDEDKRILQDRGQAPLVYNRIKPTLDWVQGSERQARVDQTVLPRRKEQSQSAEVKSQLLKYLSDVNKLPYHRSRAFADQVIVGLGWLEHGIRGDGSDEPLFDRYEDWRNMWYDHLGVELDGSDWRYVFRSRWVDLEVAQAMFPDRREDLEREAINTNRMYPLTYDDLGALHIPTDGTVDLSGSDDVFDDTGNIRQRVRLVECWYRKTERIQVVRSKRPGNGAVFRGEDPLLTWLVQEGHASLFDAIRQTVWCGIFCGKTFLQNTPSPYWHNRFPFTPLWCYRRGRDGAPYGMVRNLRDPQEDLNKRASKSLYILSTNRIIADDDATENWKEMREEADRPDGVIRKKKNSEVRLETERGVAADHLVMMDRDAKMIQDIGGVPEDSLGRPTNAESGRAIQSRNVQGLTSTAPVFDNYYLAIQISGEIRLALVEQFYDQEKTIRVAGNSGRLEFVDINRQQEDGLLNPITETQADFVIAQQDYRATMRQAMFDSMMELVQKLPPEVALNLLDLIVDMADVPGREEMVARIRALNGQRDPAADTDDPAIQEAERVKQNEAWRQQQLVEDAQQAEIDLKRATAEEKRVTTTVKSVEALYSAIQTAQVAATVPGVVPIADGIAASAGFRDQNEAPIFPQPLPPAAAALSVRENTSPMFPGQPQGPGEGMMTGIETQRLDGIGG
jgi:hypothetical protein